MYLETERLIITEFTPDMAQAVHENSLDENNKRFVPDEVWETAQEAEETLRYLISRYDSPEGPFVYPVLIRETQANIGYVQLCPIGGGKWEIGYHIAEKYTGRGYASEAAAAFLPVIARQRNIREIRGICLAENKASLAVLRKCGFETVFEGTGLYQGAEREIVESVWKFREAPERTVLKTKRLILRPWEESDAESLFEYARDVRVGPAAGWPPHKSREDSLKIIQTVLSVPETYAVCLKEDNKPIGSIGLKLNGSTDMTDRDDECELGYWLGVPFWGRGIIPEAAGEIIRHAFNDLGMKTICAAIMTATRNQSGYRKNADSFFTIPVKMFPSLSCMKYG